MTIKSGLNVKKSDYLLKELATITGTTLVGEGDCVIRGLATLQAAKPDQITFLANPLYKKYLSTTQAGAVIIDNDDLAACPTNALVSQNPKLVFAQLGHYFASGQVYKKGIHTSAIVGEEVNIDASVAIGPYCVIGDRVSIAAGVCLGAHCVIGEGVHIGANSHLAAKVTVQYNCIVGQNNCIDSGTVIGSEGFGFAHDEAGMWHKVPQLGRVVLGDHVEIGANTTVDRGALDDTLIGDGVKIDNLVQIGHNVRIGQHTVIAGCVGIAGSTHIGRYCALGGATGVGGHLRIADHVQITGMAMVTRSITKPGIYSSGTGIEENRRWRKNVARFRRLDNLTRTVSQLQKTIDELSKK